MSGRQFFGYLALTGVTIVFAVIFVLAVRILTLPTPGPPAPKTDAPYYVVRRGDTLSAIAQKTGVAVEQLMRLNRQADPLALVPGKRLRLRASAPPPGRRRNGRRRPLPHYYVVRRGDTLSGVAAKFGVPLYRLFALNRGIRRDLVVPGQRIRLRPARTGSRRRPARRDT